MKRKRIEMAIKPKNKTPKLKQGEITLKITYEAEKDESPPDGWAWDELLQLTPFVEDVEIMAYTQLDDPLENIIYPEQQ